MLLTTNGRELLFPVAINLNSRVAIFQFRTGNSCCCRSAARPSPTAEHSRRVAVFLRNINTKTDEFKLRRRLFRDGNVGARGFGQFCISFFFRDLPQTIVWICSRGNRGRRGNLTSTLVPQRSCCSSHLSAGNDDREKTARSEFH